MTVNALERDCLFQLNVLIWATFPQPANSPITPVIRAAGYELYSIEQPLQASLGERPALQASSTAIHPNPVADVVLHNGGDSLYVLVECKPGSFGPDSSNCRQARGMIAAGGRVRARLQVAHGEAEVSYALPADEATAMTQTLVTLRGEVTTASVPDCEVGTVGIRVVDDGALLGANDEPVTAVRFPRALMPEKRVITVDPGQDPRPLYVVPWIPGATDEADLRAFHEKLRSQVLSELGRAEIGSTSVLTYNDLLDAVTMGVFSAWRDRSTLDGRVHPQVRNIISQLVDRDRRVAVRDHQVEFKLEAANDRDAIMERVRASDLPERAPEGIQEQLFKEEQP